MPQEHSSTHVTVAVEPKKVEKPQKKGLFSRFSNKKSTMEQLNEEKIGSKDSLLKSIGKPKTQETLAKKPRTGLFSNLLKNNRQKKDKQVETTAVQVSSQKTLKVDASSKQVDNKTISTIVEKSVNPEAKIVKVPESASLMPPVNEPEQIIKPKSDSGVTDLLKSTNEASKVRPSESDSPHLKSASGPVGQVELKKGAGDSAKLSTLSITSEVQKAAQTPLVTADSGIKADDILKMTR